MKTVIRSQLLKIYYISLLVLIGTDKINAFQMNDTLYINYNDKMMVNDIKDPLGDYQVRLNIALISKGDDRVTTYEFSVNNINEDFEYLQFNKIGDTISQKEINSKFIKQLEDLSQYSACDLLFLLADTKNVFLLKAIGKDFIRYKLQYLCTKQGWLIDKSGFRY